MYSFRIVGFMSPRLSGEREYSLLGWQILLRVNAHLLGMKKLALEMLEHTIAMATESRANFQKNSSDRR